MEHHFMQDPPKMRDYDRTPASMRREQEADIAAMNAMPELRDDAIAFLAAEIPPGMQEQIRKEIARQGEGWCDRYSLGWGTGIRNMLRQNGFGEIHFKLKSLDNVYVWLIEQAVKTKQPAR